MPYPEAWENVLLWLKGMRVEFTGHGWGKMWRNNEYLIGNVYQNAGQDYFNGVAICFQTETEEEMQKPNKRIS